MKKMMALTLVVVTLLVTGCSVRLDTSPSIIESKSEKLEEKAKVLQHEFDKALNLVIELEDKNEISSKDQERVADQLESVLSVVDEFKEIETPIIGQKVKDIAGGNLRNREELLKTIQEKAEEGTLTKDDLPKMEKALSDDMNIKLFN